MEASRAISAFGSYTGFDGLVIRARASRRVRRAPDPKRPSEIVEFTVDGQFVAQMSVDPAPGSAFGLAFGLALGLDSKRHLQFTAVDDATNTATVWTLRTDSQ
ncbi:hypothetical protein HDG34_002840 [Paraburkholderia sp. HC6.4b]|nr:hypothetical protein [Paraburkholderia sp. HC6.4b]MBB5450631.1 hypothetical protein [Paraburkholderia sp. Kb1A]